MKKAIAVLLSVLCVLSCFGAVALAADDYHLGSLFGIEEDDKPLLYALTYKNETLSGVKMMYEPNPSLSLSGPGYVKVTKDQPIAIDHDFVCWKDKNGKLYYAGDEFFVDGECTLYAVWEDKKDNYIRPIRVFRCAMLTMGKLFANALGIFKDIQDFREDFFEAKKRAVEAYNEAMNTAKKQQNIKIDVLSRREFDCTKCPVYVYMDKAKAIFKAFNDSSTASYTVADGKTTDGKTANDLIRPFGELSAMNADGNIASGSVQDLENGGKKIVIVLFKETASQKPYETILPKYHKNFLEPIDFSAAPDDIESAEFNYSKTTIRATVDSEGKLVEWTITAPATGSAHVVIENAYVDVEFESVLRDEYKFTY